MDDPATQRDVERGRPMPDIELGKNVLHVHLRRRLADAERRGDFLVLKPLRYQVEDLDLARRQVRLLRPLRQALRAKWTGQGTR